MPRAVLLGGLDEALDLPVGEIFTAALANCYTEVEAALRSREFSMKTALPPVGTVTNLIGRLLRPSRATARDVRLGVTITELSWS